MYNIKVMDPISNKKEFDDLTINLRDLAYSYIEKYNPSKQQTKTYLLKKYLKNLKDQKQKKRFQKLLTILYEFRKKSLFK